MKNWIEKTENNTDEFITTTNGGKAILLAEKLDNNETHFEAMCILRGIGLDVPYLGKKIEYVHSRKMRDNIEVLSIYAKII